MNINLAGSIADLQEALKDGQILILSKSRVILGNWLAASDLEVAEKLEAQVDDSLNEIAAILA